MCGTGAFSRLFWTPNGTRLTARCHFTGPKKVRFPGPSPLPRNGRCPHQKHYARGRRIHRCILVRGSGLCVAGYLNVGAASSSPLGLLNLFSGSSFTSDQLACRVTCSGQSWVLSMYNEISLECPVSFVKCPKFSVQCSFGNVMCHQSCVQCLLWSVPCPVSKFTDLWPILFYLKSSVNCPVRCPKLLSGGLESTVRFSVPKEHFLLSSAPRIHRPLSSVHYQLSTFYCPLSNVHCPLSSVHCHLSTVPCPLSTVHCPLSTVHCPLSTVISHCPLSAFNFPLGKKQSP